MSTATASIADVFRIEHKNKGNNHGRNYSVHTQAQCTPIPLPALGTQRIIQGNGTNVGTVISLQCPAKHKLIGRDLTCVMDHNSTHWVGETYCKPLLLYEDYGFRVAVLASIVSSAIILLMSVAFITCCWLDCIKHDQKRERERESDMWQWEEQVLSQEDNRSRHNHKGRNNNNNNTREKMLRESNNSSLNENVQPCRCQQQYDCGPARTYASAPPLAALPGHDYDQPLLPQNLNSSPPEYPWPPPSSSQSASPGLVQISRMGTVAWQYGGPQAVLAQMNTPGEDEAGMRNMNPRNKNPQEFSIRIISV